mmetsp:Transcript_16431/g.45800  ORF Transcript_16431/g.45800 Transcript_16431/m.45800 type:complete len:286 (-) Transcript_16431:108-965(-)
MAPRTLHSARPMVLQDASGAMKFESFADGSYLVFCSAMVVAIVLLGALRQRHQQSGGGEDGSSAGEGEPLDSESEQTALAGAPSAAGDTSFLQRIQSRETLVIGGLLICAAIVAQADVMWSSRMAAKQASANNISGYQCTALSRAEHLRHYGTLEGFSHPIHTRVSAAQRHFDQGLMNLFNFNQREALRSFWFCAEEDPESAMCHWGMAYAHGPFVNKVEHSEDPVVGPTYYPAYGPAAHAAAHAAAMSAAELASAAAAGDPESGWFGCCPLCAEVSNWNRRAPG